MIFKVCSSFIMATNTTDNKTDDLYSYIPRWYKRDPRILCIITFKLIYNHCYQKSQLSPTHSIHHPHHRGTRRAWSWGPARGGSCRAASQWRWPSSGVAAGAAETSCTAHYPGPLAGWPPCRRYGTWCPRCWTAPQPACCSVKGDN